MNEFIFLASSEIADVSGDAVKEWLLISLGVIGGASLVVNLFHSLRPKKPHEVQQPVDIRQIQEAVTREEFDKLERRVESIDDRLPLMQEKILSAIEEQSEKTREMVDKVEESARQARLRIHEKVNEQGREITAIRTRQEGQ